MKLIVRFIMDSKSKILCSLSFFMIALSTHGQVSFKLDGVDYSVNGELICQYQETKTQEPHNISIYVEITKDSLFLDELDYSQNNIYCYTTDRIALNEIYREDQLQITPKQKDKTIYEFWIFGLDFQEKIVHFRYLADGSHKKFYETAMGKSSIRKAGMTLAFSSEENAKNFYTQLMQNK